MLPIFADGDTMPIAWLAIIIPSNTAFTVVLGYLFNYWLKKKELGAQQAELERKNKLEDEDRAIDHWKTIGERLQAENDRQDERIQTLELDRLRMLAWIRGTEDKMRARGEKFEAWDLIVARTPTPKPARRTKIGTEETKAE